MQIVRMNTVGRVLLGIILVQLMSSTICGDNLALLSGTLRTFQKTTCDSERVSLGCPRGTSISIELAQYEKNGIDGYSLCPTASTEIVTGTDATANGTAHSNEISNHQESCLWPNALQYSLLQTAIEACQKKTHCKFLPAPKSFGGNPCPGVRKIIEYAYKCRPYEFRSKVACENEVIILTCNPFSRIAIYSASYGRTEYESIQCTQPQGVKEETCLVSFATETVMQLCHGRRRCTISADTQTFGNPCRPDSRMYLKTVYTCVPRKVLLESFDVPIELDEQNQQESDYENELDEDDGHYKEAIPPAPKLQGTIPRSDSNTTQTITTKSSTTTLGDVKNSDSVQNQRSFSEAHYDEIFYICLFFGIAVLILLSSIMIVFGRIILHKRSASTMNSGAASVSELSTTVDAMTKLQSSDTIVVTTMNNDNDTNITKTGTNINNSTDKRTENTSDIDLTTPISIPSISNRNNQQHLYNTYTPSSYGNLEPSSISYALVTPDIYNGNQTMALHSTMMRPPSNQTANAAAATGIYNHTLPHNLRKAFRPSSSSPIPDVPSTLHILIPANPTQTLNRHLYHLSPLSPNSSTTSLRNTSTFLPVSIAAPPTAIVPASIVTPTSILRTTTSPSSNNESNTTTYLYG
ncbi:uncharacterized protein LOC129568237 [Sitodiplosis mosellana]|uniref:uncharacterized protein LOC129568237 n=1 Tax=Sitodiplosis mosellana TaxID=263140 RepID=UPI002444370E|nr:uncharacterized protein LOC129568237 [Sitodiplosis mosellana]